MVPVAELYRSYGKKVFNLAYRITGDRAVAEDILQEVFVKIIEHSDQFRGESRVYSWIYAITKNACLGSKKGSFRTFEKLIETAARPFETTTGDELERRYYIHQVKDGCLTGLLKCLSFHQRMAFILGVLFDVPTSTIGLVLNRNVNSVRILISRAKRNLRRFLCANCSLYSSVNRCRCENMVNFSLQNAWVLEYDPRVSPRVIEAELKDFKSEVLLYRSLSERDPPERIPCSNGKI